MKSKQYKGYKQNKVYICIDLKTFFASVECTLRGLNPFTTNLIVADPDRGKGTITLAITPKMKMLGIKNRCRVYEIPPNISYITAKPRINTYMQFSAKIYEMYLEYFSKEDIYVYSVDEVFIDVTPYLKLYKKCAINIARFLKNEIKKRFNLYATVGIGTNLYLAKIALDIISKHNSNSIGILNENLYIKKLGNHRPITDFWQVGPKIAKRLAKYGIYTMNDISIYPSDILYKEFGVDAQFLIDHSKGQETCTISEIRNYIPKQESIANSQILFRDYNFEDAKLVLKEMIELGTLRLIEKNLYTNCIAIYIGYTKDIIKQSTKQITIPIPTNSYNNLLEVALYIYEQIVNKEIPIRRIGFSFSNLIYYDEVQLSLFENDQKQQAQFELFKKINEIKQKHGRDKIFRAMDLTQDAIAMQRNMYIGGHNASY